MMNKKTYEEPESLICLFENEDVITSSGEPLAAPDVFTIDPFEEIEIWKK